ncbi:MAG: hypothetical protein Q8N74_00400, partial [Sulfuricella sp.]|nr:hypothetical protein [Sulfuricella sp.]
EAGHKAGPGTAFQLVEHWRVVLFLSHSFLISKKIETDASSSPARQSCQHPELIKPHKADGQCPPAPRAL